MTSSSFWLAATAVAVALYAGNAQSPPLAGGTLSILPAQPAPGAVVRVRLRLGSENAADVVRGTMAGEPLHFVRAAPGEWHALGAVPVDAQRSVVARATVEEHGRVDSFSVSVPVPPIPKRRAEPLKVDTGFTAPDPAREARIARENERARDVGRRAHETPPLWTGSFLRPRSSVITSMFGSGRVFNGELTSRHLGVDFRGAVGEPVRAANRGIVAVVDSFVLAGNVIYIDHGGGVVTGYFHLSKQLVQVGDTVSRGQIIGAVGQSGRVTGPHLHWSARYGALTVNPLDLLAIKPDWYSASTSARRPPRTPASSSPVPR
ncbi:MAG TPA: M23 family metallopeptidase [Gemmatimonadaceae bacterium]|nr:M23 family metallopeptidase [Gemmatimonadaceae bacterium]